VPLLSRRCIHFSLPRHVAHTSGRAVYLTDRDGYRSLSSFDVNAYTPRASLCVEGGTALGAR
jgi:hypothetical protein